MQCDVLQRSDIPVPGPALDPADTALFRDEESTPRSARLHACRSRGSGGADAHAMVLDAPARGAGSRLHALLHFRPGGAARRLAQALRPRGPARSRALPGGPVLRSERLHAADVDPDGAVHSPVAGARLPRLVDDVAVFCDRLLVPARARRCAGPGGPTRDGFRALPGSAGPDAWTSHTAPDGSARGLVRAARARSGLFRRSAALRSEEHTSELQSPCNLVCRLLLEKKKKKK